MAMIPMHFIHTLYHNTVHNICKIAMFLFHFLSVIQCSKTVPVQLQPEGNITLPVFPHSLCPFAGFGLWLWWCATSCDLWRGFNCGLQHGHCTWHINPAGDYVRLHSSQSAPPWKLCVRGFANLAHGLHVSQSAANCGEKSKTSTNTTMFTERKLNVGEVWHSDCSSTVLSTPNKSKEITSERDVGVGDTRSLSLSHCPTLLEQCSV